MIKKTLSMSAFLVAVISALSIAYGFITLRAFTLAFAFIANFAVGAVIILAGFALLLTPTFLLNSVRKSNLIDHTTGQRLWEEREKKRVRAYELMYIGMSNISITAVVQLALWYVL